MFTVISLQISLFHLLALSGERSLVRAAELQEPGYPSLAMEGTSMQVIFPGITRQGVKFGRFSGIRCPSVRGMEVYNKGADLPGYSNMPRAAW